jgi:HNH endonuclease
MGHQDRLKSLADNELLAGLSRVVGKRNEITAEFLAYLAELDQRQLFLDLGYPSLFDYCVKALKLCESTAGRHIAAARVCRIHPQAFDLVACGELHASALSLMKKHITPENGAELLALCIRKSAREVEEVLAARFPKPDVPDSVRRLLAPFRPTPNVGSETGGPSTEAEKAKPTSGAHTNGIRPNALQPAASTRAPEAPKARRLEPLSADRCGVHFTADSEFRELLERVRGLAGHRLPSGDLLTLMKRGLEAYERELEKERFALGRKPRVARRASERSDSNRPPPATAPGPESALAPSAAPLFSASAPAPTSAPGRRPFTRPRRLRAAFAREVFVRDGKQCSYVSDDGRRCASRRRLELDHIHPWALGGDDAVRNLRVLCKAHNQRYARQCFGELHVLSALARKRRQAPVRSSSGK